MFGTLAQLTAMYAPHSYNSLRVFRIHGSKYSCICLLVEWLDSVSSVGVLIGDLVNVWLGLSLDRLVGF